MLVGTGNREWSGNRKARARHNVRGWHEEIHVCTRARARVVAHVHRTELSDRLPGYANSNVVLTRCYHARQCEREITMEGAHPIPPFALHSLLAVYYLDKSACIEIVARVSVADASSTEPVHRKREHRPRLRCNVRNPRPCITVLWPSDRFMPIPRPVTRTTGKILHR